MHIDITKIVIHEDHEDLGTETVFIFTPHKLDDDNWLQFHLKFPVGKGKEWVEKELKTATYEVARFGMEVIAPA